MVNGYCRFHVRNEGWVVRSTRNVDHKELGGVLNQLDSQKMVEKYTRKTPPSRSFVPCYYCDEKQHEETPIESENITTYGMY